MMTSKRVLVVEDDPSIRGLLQAVLEDEALEVVLAADGEEGLRLARSIAPDVVLLDVMMPGLGGPEVIHRLRRGDGSLPFGVLVVTGAAEIVAPLRGELGHDAVLEKPFDIVTLADRVKTLAGIPEGSGEPPGGVRGTRHGLPGESQGAPEIKEPT
jgi:DNA-binding response OmpR family regulator